MTQRNFEKGDLVWAKIKGYPWWPASVSAVLKASTPDSPSILVNFIGDNSHAKLPRDKIAKFDEKLKEYSKTNNRKLSQSIATAVKILKGDSTYESESRKLAQHRKKLEKDEATATPTDKSSASKSKEPTAKDKSDKKSSKVGEKEKPKGLLAKRKHTSSAENSTEDDTDKTSSSKMVDEDTPRKDEKSKQKMKPRKIRQLKGIDDESNEITKKDEPKEDPVTAFINSVTKAFVDAKTPAVESSFPIAQIAKQYNTVIEEHIKKIASFDDFLKNRSLIKWIVFLGEKLGEFKAVKNPRVAELRTQITTLTENLKTGLWAQFSDCASLASEIQAKNKLISHSSSHVTSSMSLEFPSKSDTRTAVTSTLQIDAKSQIHVVPNEVEPEQILEIIREEPVKPQILDSNAPNVVLRKKICQKMAKLVQEVYEVERSDAQNIAIKIESLFRSFDPTMQEEYKSKIYIFMKSLKMKIIDREEILAPRASFLQLFIASEERGDRNGGDSPPNEYLLPGIKRQISQMSQMSQMEDSSDSNSCLKTLECSAC